MTGSVSANAAVAPRARIFALIGGLLAFVVLIALGSWQVQRLHWKEGLLAEIDQRIHSKPLPLADVIQRFTQTQDVDYVPVTVTGLFDYSKEQYFFATHNGATGYFVYTPFLPQGDAEFANYNAVLVNSGFIPYERRDPASRMPSVVAGPITITGLARNPLGEKPSWVVPDNEPVKNIYYWKDITLMARQAGIEGPGLIPFFIDADATPNPGGLPIGGVTMVDLPNSHLQYAVTWFGLAAALAAVLGVWLWRGRAGAVN